MLADVAGHADLADTCFLLAWIILTLTTIYCVATRETFKIWVAVAGIALGAALGFFAWWVL